MFPQIQHVEGQYFTISFSKPDIYRFILAQINYSFLIHWCLDVMVTICRWHFQVLFPPTKMYIFNMWTSVHEMAMWQACIWWNMNWVHCHMYAWHNMLTHWGWVTHICVGNLTNIGSDNCLSPGQCQAIIWTNAGVLLNRTSGTNFGGNFVSASMC